FGKLFSSNGEETTVQSVAQSPAPNKVMAGLHLEMSKMWGPGKRRIMRPVLFVPMVLVGLALFGLLWIPNLVKGSASDPSVIPGGFVKLVGEAGERVIVSTIRGPVGAGESVAVNELVTVRFKILDNDVRAF